LSQFSVLPQLPPKAMVGLKEVKIYLKISNWLCFSKYVTHSVGVFKICFVIVINQMFGSSQKFVEQKPLEDANFLSVYDYVYKCMFVLICLHASRGRCAKNEPSSYGLCETKNKWCGSCILTTKHVTQTNYYDICVFP